MVKVKSTSKYYFPDSVAEAAEKLCNKPDVLKVISVNFTFETDKGYTGFVTYEAVDDIDKEKGNSIDGI